MNYFALNLKHLRETKKLTQRKLGELVGVKANTISNYENRISEPDLNLLIKLSQALDIQIDFLLKADLSNMMFETDLSIGKTNKFVEPNVDLSVDVIDENLKNQLVSDVQEKYASEASYEALQRSRLFQVLDDKMLPALGAGMYVLAYPIPAESMQVNQLSLLQLVDNHIIGKITLDRDNALFVVSFERTDAAPRLIKESDVEAIYVPYMKCTLISK